MAELSKKKTTAMLLSVALGTFMSALDSSVVNIAEPVIQGHFNVPLATVEWVITAYLMVISSMLLFFGRISDLYGQKKIYMMGFGTFTVGSLLCGLSSSIGMLIACRVFQAIGSAMMFSSNNAIITQHVPARNRGKSLSVVAMSVAIALSAGPVLGGTLTGLFGWQSIFYINVPIGVLGIFLSAKNIPADAKSALAPLDVRGSLMVFAALFLILLPIDQLSQGMNLYLFFAMLLIGIALVVLFLRYEKKVSYPMLNLKLFKNRVFSAGLAAANLNFIAQFIMTFLIPFYLQKERMMSPAMAGILYIPMPLTMLLVAPLAGIAADRMDTRYLSSAGMGVMAIGLFMLSFLSASTPLSYIVCSMIVAGLGCGLFQTPNNSAIMGNVPAENRGIASGMLATSRNMGMVLGVALSGALFDFFSDRGNALFTKQGLQGTALQQSAFSYALHITFLAACAFAVIAMVVSLNKGKVKTGSELEAEARKGK